MPQKVDFSFWLKPPCPGTAEEYDIPAVARELDERFPEVLRKWPDIRLRRSKLSSGLPRVVIFLRISKPGDSAQALEALFGIARDLGGWEIHNEQTFWTIDDEEDRQDLLDCMEQAIEREARWRMERRIEIAFVPLVIVFCFLALGAVAGLVSGWLFLAFLLILIVLAIFLGWSQGRPARSTPDGCRSD